jgi:putative ABC transport system substrate-binding protein
MRRRVFITLLGGACIGWPLASRAQQSARPAIGFLRSTPELPHLLAALREGLKEGGFVEGRNVAIEQRYADNRLDRLPDLAADLVRRRVAVIVGNSLGAKAAKRATENIPIVFVIGEDPVDSGLVSNLARPGGNVTGVTFFGAVQLIGKQVELLHELIPDAAVFAALVDSSDPRAESRIQHVLATGRAIGRRIVIVKTASEHDLDNAFASMAQARARAVLVVASPRFNTRGRELVAAAARYAIPAIYTLKEYVEVGGLISYSASQTGAYRQAGEYVARILKGAQPSELPVLQPTTFELAINLKTAKALGLNVPQSILLRADEVIE